MAHIVVFGAGIGGISMTFKLRESLGKEHHITLLNNNSYFQFTPSNPWVGVGWREKSQITVELAPLMKKHGVEFVQQAVEKVEPEKLLYNSRMIIRWTTTISSSQPDQSLHSTKFRGSGQRHTPSGLISYRRYGNLS